MREPWRFFHRHIAEVECWYAYGFAFEVEWSHVFRGIYFKIACVGFHIGFWKEEQPDMYYWMKRSIAPNWWERFLNWIEGRK